MDLTERVPLYSGFHNFKRKNMFLSRYIFTAKDRKYRFAFLNLTLGTFAIMLLVVAAPSFDKHLHNDFGALNTVWS